MKALVLTLGHNSSAAFVEDGIVKVAYEEERLSGIKSDSAFPKKAIEYILKHECQKFDHCFVGHWFNNGDLLNCKYFDRDYILDLVPNKECISSIGLGFTHHDSHVVAAESFYDSWSTEPLTDGDFAIVADGFGTFGECLSIYSYQGDNIRKLDKRAFNYSNSLGLLYQYATLFLGMKMHNHEYKMLGYEAHIHEEFAPRDVEKLDYFIEKDAKEWVKNLFVPALNSSDPIVNKDALDECKKQTFDRLHNVCQLMDEDGIAQIYKKRVAISYYVQGIVEQVMMLLVMQLNPKKLLVSGGLFYNVKLNNLLSKNCEQLCILPVAGDQGAGFGVYQYYTGDLQFPKYLALGYRNLHVSDFDQFLESNGKLRTFTNVAEMFEVIKEELASNGFVNIVGAAVEFGPRALGSTSTLAVPSIENVKLLNELNDRTFVMPMAPMMTQEQFDNYATSGHNIIGSNNFMVATVDVNAAAQLKFPGAIHQYKDSATCRPQIIEQGLYKDLCETFGPLINTSFNYHGVPIVFSADQIVESHNAQCRKAPEGVTVVTLVLVQE